jgi:hypothetical protein
MYTYKITSLVGQIHSDICPSPIISAIFPKFDGELVITDETGITIQFEKKQTPVSLGPTIKIELVELL